MKVMMARLKPQPDRLFQSVDGSSSSGSSDSVLANADGSFQ